MRRILLLLCLLTLLFVSWPISLAQAQGGNRYTVQPGDTLFSVANRHGLSIEQLATLNGLSPTTWVYAGQELALPTAGSVAVTRTQPAALATTINSEYTVEQGDTLFAIAQRYGTTVPALQTANGLGPNDFVWVGQRLTLPTGAGPAPSPSYRPATSGGERWIDVNLTTQTVIAYEGDLPAFTTLGSTGTWRFPTVAGTFQIYVKYERTRMYGGTGADAYDLSDVPYVMYFYQGYGLHGTYWHNNFGTPMSRGCVNLSIADAEWFYNWASVGTKVVTHY